MSIMEILEWIEATQIASIARESLWGFQILVGLHILGLIFSVGTLAWFDLRLLGVSMRGCPLSRVYRQLMPWTLSGFLVMFVSGTFLLAGFATAAYSNFYFRIKVVALLLAGVNAAIYHLVTERRIAQWDQTPKPPGTARLAGLTSMFLWAVIILAGRMMSYTMF